VKPQRKLNEKDQEEVEEYECDLCMDKLDLFNLFQGYFDG